MHPSTMKQLKTKNFFVLYSSTAFEMRREIYLSLEEAEHKLTANEDGMRETPYKKSTDHNCRKHATTIDNVLWTRIIY